jgi:hypothetical protein
MKINRYFILSFNTPFRLIYNYELGASLSKIAKFSQIHEIIFYPKPLHFFYNQAICLRKTLMNSFLYVPVIFLLSFSELAQAKIYNFKDLYKSLNYSADLFGARPETIDSLKLYTDKHELYYKEINGYLRYYPDDYEWYGTSPEMAEIEVRNIDKIFTLVPLLPSDMTLFRGINLSWHKDLPLKVDEEFTDLGFVSTSTDFDVAKKFAVSSPPILWKETTNAILVMYFSELKKAEGLLIDQKEDEILLPHRQHFKVMAENKLKDYTLYLVQICKWKACETSPAKLEQLQIFKRLK